MIKTIYIYIMGILILSNIVSSFALATVDENETALLEQINAIRRTPFAYGLSLGYEAATLKERGVYENLTFSPYAMNTELSRTAAWVNLKATGAASTEGCPVSLKLKYAETSGALSFFNFLPADVAVGIFAEILFKNEIDSGCFTYILSTEYNQAGVSVMAGSNEDNTNAWFFTLSLGSSAGIFEGQLVNLINQLRATPWHAVNITEMDIKNYLSMDIRLFCLLIRKMPPIFFQPELSNSARLMAESLAAADSYFFETCATEEYEGTEVKQYTGDAVIEDEDMKTVVNKVFKQIATDDMKNWQTHLGILNPKAMDIGPGIRSYCQNNAIDRMFFRLNIGIPDSVDEEPILDTAGQAKIYGLLFIDSDGDGFYAPGEEVRGRNIRIYDEDVLFADENTEIVATPKTDNAGRFILSLESDKTYRFIYTPTEDGNCEAVALKKYIDGDVFVKLALPPGLNP